jgi:glycerophosphoryl diester phosphodiesterase
MPRAFAHRGWHIGELAGLENSLAAFRRAADEGYQHIETDVHATADGVVVAHHDGTLDRTTDRAGAIHTLPWSQVARARIGGREPVSRIEEVFEELPGVRFNIDVKSDDAVEPMVRAIERTGAFDRVALASFSARRLARIRRLAGPRLAMAMGPISAGLVWFNGRLPFLPAHPMKALTRGVMAQVPQRQGWIELVSAAYVRAAHRLGAEVHVWTVDAAEQMHALFDIGVDGIVTDRPDTLRDVLRERGAWPGGSGFSAGPSPSMRPSTS